MRVVLSVSLALAFACTPQPPPPVDDGFDRQQLLSDFATGIAQPALDDFVDKMSVASADIDAWADGGDRARAQTSVLAAFAAWQHVELMQVGPIGRQGFTTAGTAHRDEIYSWYEATSPCQVDAQAVDNLFDDDDWFERSLVNVYGFDALEYLVFHPEDNACLGGHPINAGGDWDALGDGREARLAAMAGRVADGILREGRALQSEFAAFIPLLTEPGVGESPYPEAQAAVDEIFAALFYIELRTKDRKLATPLGLHISCTAELCPNRAESRWSQTSIDNVIANIEAAQMIFRGQGLDGVDRIGFDDMLKNAGAQELALELDQALTDASASASAFKDNGKRVSVEADLAELSVVHDTLKSATDTLKTEMVSVLNLRVPQEGAGDND